MGRAVQLLDNYTQKTICMTPPNIPDMATDELILGKKKKGKDKIKKDEEERVEEELTWDGEGGTLVGGADEIT